MISYVKTTDWHLNFNKKPPLGRFFVIYHFQSLTINLLPDFFTTTFCFSRQPSSRIISMGMVTAMDFRPNLISFLTFLSSIFLVGIDLFLSSYYVIYYLHLFYPYSLFSASLLGEDYQPNKPNIGVRKKLIQTLAKFC